MAKRAQATKAPDGTEQPNLPGTPPSDRIWPDYFGIPIEGVNLAFAGFKVEDREVAANLAKLRSDRYAEVQIQLINHKYVTEHDKDFGDARGRVVVTAMIKAIKFAGMAEAVVIEGEAAEVPEAESKVTPIRPLCGKMHNGHLNACEYPADACELPEAGE